MAAYLPDDVWTDILALSRERNASDGAPLISRGDLGSLASTNRRFHRLAQPLLFRVLTFDARVWQVIGERPLVDLLRAHARAKGLLHSPRLLRHVRAFQLNNWAEREPDYPSVFHDYDPNTTRDAAGFYSVIYDFVANLISHMPGLQELSLCCSPVTPLIHRAMLSCGRLHSFTAITQVNSNTRSFRLGPKPLQLSYLGYDAQETCPTTDHHFVALLAGCIHKLKTLDISSSLLSATIDCIARSSGAATPEDIRISFDEDHTTEPTMWALFRLLPTIRAVTVTERGSGGQQWTVLDAVQVLPNLESIVGPPELVRTLSVGKPLKCVDITWQFDAGVYSGQDIIGSAPAHLHSLKLHVSVQSYAMFFAFLRSLHAFRNLERFEMWVHPLGPRAANETGITQKHVCDAMVKELRQWTLLRICHINGGIWSDNPWTKDKVDRGCPFAPARNPNVRGHTSLESFSLRFAGINAWEWIPAQGWTHEPLYYLMFE